MNKKISVLLKVFTGILVFLAIVFQDMDRKLFLSLMVLGLTGILLFALIPRLHLPKHQWHWKIPHAQPAASEEDPLRTALLCQFSHRITDKLRSAYPQALWDWEKRPDIDKILSGKSVRIHLCDAAEFTHAEVSLDTYGSIHLQLLKIEELSRNPGKTSDQEELPVGCVSWYELVGAGVLNQVITDLNARGYDSLCISEKGEIFITDKDTPVVKEHFQNFPGKKHWAELVSIFQENELQAEATDTALVLSWNK